MKELKEFSISVPWGHVALKAWGSPKSFPILCMHGTLDNAGVFDRLISLLPDNYYYVSVDLPGHGLSSHFPEGIPLEFFNYVFVIHCIVETFKWKNFDFIGHSFGGQLGTFYSVIYPGKIGKLVLIEGMVTYVISEKQIIPRVKLLYNNILENLKCTKPRLYKYDEIMHSLQFRRGTCLNTDAAKAIFPRSVTREGDLFKYNRDIRLKDYCIPLFNENQLFHVISKLKAKVLLICTSATLDLLSNNSYSLSYENIVDFTKEMGNIHVMTVYGNHDVHNNNPERLKLEIIQFFNEKNFTSKL